MLQERERDSMEELEEAKQQAQTATHAFNEVRQARYDTFMKAFNHISAGIDKIFKVSSVATICNYYDFILRCAVCLATSQAALAYPVVIRSCL